MRLAIETSLRKLCEWYSIELPSKRTEDTLGPINDRLLQNKVLKRDLHSMIVSFKVQADPIAHGRVKVRSFEQARVLTDLAKIIIREIYELKKRKPKVV